MSDSNNWEYSDKIEAVRVILSYKTYRCANLNCPNRDLSKNPKQTDCEYFHSEKDLRRFPFEDPPSFFEKHQKNIDKLKQPEFGIYEFFKIIKEEGNFDKKLMLSYHYSSQIPNGKSAKNNLEANYHPLIYKRNKCCFGPNCIEKYCCNYHFESEKNNFDKFRQLIIVSNFGLLGSNAEVTNYYQNANNYLIGKNSKNSNLKNNRSGSSSAYKNYRRNSHERTQSRNFSRNKKSNFIKSSSTSQNFLSHINRSLDITRIGGNDCVKNTSKDILFLYNKEVNMYENIHTEFKHHLLLSLKVVTEYICAFLNSYGGNLYFGITDNGIVKGIQLSRKDIDEFQVNLDIALRNFSPIVLPEQVSISFHPIAAEEKQEFILLDKFVVQISIYCNGADKFYTCDDNNFYIKRNG